MSRLFLLPGSWVCCCYFVRADWNCRSERTYTEKQHIKERPGIGSLQVTMWVGVQSLYIFLPLNIFISTLNYCGIHNQNYLDRKQKAQQLSTCQHLWSNLSSQKPAQQALLLVSLFQAPRSFSSGLSWVLVLLCSCKVLPKQAELGSGVPLRERDCFSSNPNKERT